MAQVRNPPVGNEKNEILLQKKMCLFVRYFSNLCFLFVKNGRFTSLEDLLKLKSAHTSSDTQY